MVKNAPPGVNLDPKKSSFKKLSKFLASQEKTGIIKIKELQKGKAESRRQDLYQFHGSHCLSLIE